MPAMPIARFSIFDPSSSPFFVSSSSASVLSNIFDTSALPFMPLLCVPFASILISEGVRCTAGDFVRAIVAIGSELRTGWSRLRVKTPMYESPKKIVLWEVN